MSVVLNTIVPVFSIIGCGYLLGGRRGLHLPTIADLAIFVSSPALIFSVLARTTVQPAQWALLAGGTAWIAAGTGLCAYAYVRRAPGTLRGLALPAVFWNAGNMALPCAHLAFGDAGLEAAVIVFVTMVVFQSTFGIWIAKGEGGLFEIFRMPLIYACGAGLVVAATGVTVPPMVLRPITMVGDIAIPLMLINLGLQLRTLQITEMHHSLVGVGIRIGGGLLFAVLYVAVFQPGGVSRNVLLLEAIMPAAVINIVMAQRYNTNPALVASTIVLGTLLSALTIPLLLLYLT